MRLASARWPSKITSPRARLEVRHGRIDCMLLTTQRIELPSWAFRGADLRGGDASALASTRSSRAVSGVARSPYEVLADAAVVHHFTGTAPCVGLQFPSDHAADYADIACHAAELGLSISSLYVTA